MKHFFDTEFLENGRTIELISIGVVREDGAEYYAETTDAHELAMATPWLQNSVYPHLDHSAAGSRKSRFQIARDLIRFVGEQPRFWAYYADYDWVVLCQLYGRMLDLPNGWPKYCRDLKQHVDELGLYVGIGKIDLPSQPSNAHNALADARWVRDAYASLDHYRNSLGVVC